MKSLRLTGLIVGFCLFTYESGIGQIIVDAGNDTIYCNYDWKNVVLGGNPTATGGTAPYTYTWSANYFYVSRYFTASFMLNDTTIANPVLKDSPFHDTATFYLEVFDSNNDFGIDSVTIGFSWLYAELIECREHIKNGDSIQLYHYVFGGIPPYSFYWIPEETLSDPTAEFPWAKPTSNTKYELTVTDAIGCEHPFYCNIYVEPSGIEEDPQSKIEITFHPNPTSDNVVISIQHCCDFDNTQIEIRSLEGKLLIEKKFHQSNTIINLNDLLSGVYIYQIFSQGVFIQSGKIIVY